MSTTIHPELSDKNKHKLERHRYYELKHFCLQYPLWVQKYNSLLRINSKSVIDVSNARSDGSETENLAIERAKYFRFIHMVNEAAKKTDYSLYPYIVEGVTKGVPYDILQVRHPEIPCGRSEYYAMYRKFFWILSNFRD